VVGVVVVVFVVADVDGTAEVVTPTVVVAFVVLDVDGTAEVVTPTVVVATVDRLKQGPTTH
jgi:hypothetical protein